ncbi:hypothetical protein PVAP13_6KG253900 [Panicum virgatum]|uniref:Uncharacterized protein n=1 Tax=Panicum virgatum TaxID=38727 RepID=A0A8T0RET6_PANVG|nr:hypothetical protein PVAP13_6KG253900 [Panicum virgatum]
MLVGQTILQDQRVLPVQVMNGSPHSKLDSPLHQQEQPAAVCRVECRHCHQMVADQGSKEHVYLLPVPLSS